jgi:hypothetical protein
VRRGNHPQEVKDKQEDRGVLEGLYEKYPLAKQK